MTSQIGLMLGPQIGRIFFIVFIESYSVERLMYNSSSNEITLTWQPPLQSNGLIHGYEVSMVIIKSRDSGKSIFISYDIFYVFLFYYYNNNK